MLDHFILFLESVDYYVIRLKVQSLHVSSKTKALLCYQ